MTNPFDQFDAPTANPFDKFDATGGGVRLYSPNPDAPTVYGAVPGTYQNGVRIGDARSDYYETVDPARVVGQTAQNFGDRFIRGLSLIPDAIAAGYKAVGSIPQDTRRPSDVFIEAKDDLASLPLRFRDALAKGSLSPIFAPRDAYNPQTRVGAPQTYAERIAAGVGSGAGDVASSVIPARAIAGATAPNSIPNIVAEGLAAKPVAQTGFSAAGNTVGNITGDPNLGAATTALLPFGTHVTQRTVSAAPAVTTQETERRALLEFGRENDLGPLTAGKILNSGKLQTVESASSKIPLPFIGGRVAATEDAARNQFQKKVLERAGTFGETAATPTVLENIEARLGDQFKNLVKNTTINITPKFGTDLASIKAEYGDRLFEDVQPGLMKRIDQLATASSALNGPGNPRVTVAGRAYQNIRSDLSRISGTASKPADRTAAGKMVEALDDMAEGSLPPSQMEDWRNARQQYRNYINIRDAVQGSHNTDTALGNIPVARFAREVEGNPDLARYGQYGTMFVGDKAANTSRTASHGQANHLLTGGLGGLLGAGGAHAAGLDPVTMLKAGAAATVPYALEFGMNNPVTRAALLARYRNPSPSYVTPSLVGASIVDALKQLP